MVYIYFGNNNTSDSMVYWSNASSIPSFYAWTRWFKIFPGFLWPIKSNSDLTVVPWNTFTRGILQQILAAPIKRLKHYFKRDTHIGSKTDQNTLKVWSKVSHMGILSQCIKPKVQTSYRREKEHSTLRPQGTQEISFIAHMFLVMHPTSSFPTVFDFKYLLCLLEVKII